MDFKSYFHNTYQGGESFVNEVIIPIFGEDKYEDAYEEDMLESNPELENMAASTGISQIIRLCKIDIPLSPTHVFDITVKDHIQMERNRVAIQLLVRRIMRTYSSAFMIFHYDDTSKWDWRFTFCSKRGKNSDMTDSKRYTFLLGPNQSCRTAAENFMTLFKKRGNIGIDDIIKAFDVEALSKEFFDKYKLHYERFCNFVYEHKDDTEYFGSEFATCEEKRIRDYVKKLLGRIVFLHFLQKKGWMGVPVDKDWGEGDLSFMKNMFDNASEAQKYNYLDEVLEPLFEDVNTKRIDDISACGKFKVPYLNGGLFERDDMDEPKSRFPKELFANLFQFFYEYNFTIDENDPNDAQVGVDPEMLGRIFENLLEDNKDKGAFYTPKEIVQYMCKESLIAYLQTDITDEGTKESVRKFVSTYDISELDSEEFTAIINQKLKDVKICDPAIGSGAFPMGLLKELFLCRGAIEQFDNAAEIKRHIIQNNIYGVDIEKGAVDIARLRFWLALIVDEVTPHALPNMDFKIMQGNSLLEEYMGVPLDDIYDNSRQMMFAFDEETSARMLLKEHMSTYFEKEDCNEKKEILKSIDNAVKAMVKAKTWGNPDVSTAIDFLNLRNNQDFFLWHTWFNDVFSRGGFDIVIGNPPYFVYEGKNKREIETLKKLPQFKIALGGKLNAYKLFLAHALNCLVKKLGTACFIFQNSFMADLQAANLRQYVLDNCQILSIDSFPERDSKKKRVFESVKMSVCILLTRNQKSANPFIVNIWDDKNRTSGTLTNFSKSEINTIDKVGHSIPRISEELKPIIIKMLKKYHYKIKCNEGELNVTSHRQYFSTDSSLPIIMKGAGIQRYYFTYKMSQGSIEYLKEKEYLAALGTSEKAQHHYHKRIVMQGMTGANDKIRLVMTIVPAGIYLGHSCKYIMQIEELPLECILAIMNSKISNTFFRCFSTNSNVNGYEIENIPIPKINNQTQAVLVAKVTEILSSKKLNPQADTSSLEAEIDRLVYDLYDLTEEEIAIIEGVNS